MKLVVADPLPSSAIELLRSVPGWIGDGRAQRSIVVMNAPGANSISVAQLAIG